MLSITENTTVAEIAAEYNRLNQNVKSAQAVWDEGRKKFDDATDALTSFQASVSDALVKGVIKPDNA